jgi:glutamyl-tRNA reductase
MLDQLVLNNFYSGFDHNEFAQNEDFTLATCQRTLILTLSNNPYKDLKDVEGHKCLIGLEAYSYLLETICGLKSKLVGENEIVGQFKTAYKDYVSLEKSKRCSKLLTIIEKLFKDAKKIRTEYLLGLTQKTYSSIARKHIVNKHKADSVLILGSGQLAEDLINQFKKKTNVFISGRNTEKVKQLARLHNVEIVPWGYHGSLLKFPYIANSIGFNGVLFNEDFFADWYSRHDKKLFVDLGSPSAVDTKFSYLDGVMKLDDVFKEGAVHETQKLDQIEKARMAMKSIAIKRLDVFKEKKLKKQTFQMKSLEPYVENI